MATYQAVPYTDFHELVETWTKHAQSIETQAKSLSENARAIGTPGDTMELRAKLEDNERRLHNIASKTKDILKELALEMNRRKKLSKDDYNTITKVKAAMEKALETYKTAITNVGKKLQEFPNPNNNSLIDMENDDFTADDIHERLLLQQQLRMNNNILIQENEEQFVIEEQIQQVQSDVVEINHMMRDIAAMVSEASPMIADIEDTVTAANDNIAAGNTQLNSAAKYQKKYRKKLCILLIIFTLIAFVVAIFLFLKFKH